MKFITYTFNTKKQDYLKLKLQAFKNRKIHEYEFSNLASRNEPKSIWNLSVAKKKSKAETSVINLVATVINFKMSVKLIGNTRDMAISNFDQHCTK